ncbi:hypothetical protein DL93DRAFT_2207817 [Clavulina sp. PMI_390]|nr:hypothetical protein DL93DRAFT_2207817 [Clavulina sp. PMI_390]
MSERSSSGADKFDWNLSPHIAAAIAEDLISKHMDATISSPTPLEAEATANTFIVEHSADKPRTDHGMRHSSGRGTDTPRSNTGSDFEFLAIGELSDHIIEDTDHHTLSLSHAPSVETASTTHYEQLIRDVSEAIAAAARANGVEMMFKRVGSSTQTPHASDPGTFTASAETSERRKDIPGDVAGLSPDVSQIGAQVETQAIDGKCTQPVTEAAPAIISSPSPNDTVAAEGVASKLLSEEKRKRLQTIVSARGIPKRSRAARDALAADDELRRQHAALLAANMLSSAKDIPQSVAAATEEHEQNTSSQAASVSPMLHVQVGDQGPFLSMETGTPLLTNDPNHIPFTQISNERPISSPATLPPVVECRDAASPASRPAQLASCDISISSADDDHLSSTALAPDSPTFPMGKASSSAAAPITGSLPTPLSAEERKKLEATAKKIKGAKQKAEARRARAALDADDELIQKLQLASTVVDAHPLDTTETNGNTCFSGGGTGVTAHMSGDNSEPLQGSATLLKNKTSDLLETRDVLDLAHTAAVMSAAPQDGEVPLSLGESVPKLDSGMLVDTALIGLAPATPVTKAFPLRPSVPETSLPLPDCSSQLDVELGTFDGDICFSTADQKIITAHSLVLRGASALFRGPEALHKQTAPDPIPLNCTGHTLRTLLDLLYPIDQRPPITSSSELTEMLFLTRELQISSFWVREMLSDLIELEPQPLRSWALATVFRYPDAQRSAIERYFRSDLVLSDNLPEELHLLDAYQIMQLNISKERAIEAARNAMLRVDMKCASCYGDIDPPDVVLPPFPPSRFNQEASALLKLRYAGSSNHPIASNISSPNTSTALHAPVEVTQWYEAPVQPKRLPWHTEYINRTASLNPFLEFVTSDAIFEMCYASQDCSSCCYPGKTSFVSNRAKTARAMLRDRFDAIITDEIQEKNDNWSFIIRRPPIAIALQASIQASLTPNFITIQRYTPGMELQLLSITQHYFAHQSYDYLLASWKESRGLQANTLIFQGFACALTNFVALITPRTMQSSYDTTALKSPFPRSTAELEATPTQPHRLSEEERTRLQKVIKSKLKKYTPSQKEAARRALDEDDELVATQAAAAAAISSGEAAIDAECMIFGDAAEGVPVEVYRLEYVASSADSSPFEQIGNDTDLPKEDDPILRTPHRHINEFRPPLADEPPEPSVLIATTSQGPPAAEPILLSIPPTPSTPTVIPNAVDAVLDKGDFCFSSSDGMTVRAHSLLLNTASPLFREFSGEQPFRIRQSSNALKTLLQFIYPMNTKPSITDVIMLREVLEVADALRITSFVVREALNELIKAESHPLRSWALATAFKYPDAQRAAIERYFRSDSAFLDDIPDEAHLVDAFQILHLIAAKQRALGAARESFSTVEWSCSSCCSACPRHRVLGKCRCIAGSSGASHIPCGRCETSAARYSCICSAPTADCSWLHDYRTRVGAINPFTSEATAEMTFKLSFLLCPPTCGHGIAAFDSPIALSTRSDFRGRLSDIMSDEMRSLMVTEPDWDTQIPTEDTS